MKNKLYEVFDRITMILSPLVEGFFDHTEELSARLKMRRSRKHVQTTPDVTFSQDARVMSARRTESFGW